MVVNPEEKLRTQRRRAVFRWIRAGGVVIAFDADFGLSDTVLEGETLQVTTNLRAIGNACRRLTDYVVYLWNCERQADYELCIGRRLGPAKDGLVARIAPACFAGGRPSAHLEISSARSSVPDGGSVGARLVLPRGLCAFIYQRNAAAIPRTRPRLNLEPRAMSDSQLMAAMLEASE